MNKRLYIHTCTIQKRSIASTNQSGEPIYTWSNDQANVQCRFMNRNCSAIIDEMGEFVVEPQKIFIVPSATLWEHDYRITSTVTGFAKTWRLVDVAPVYNAKGLDHYECDIKSDLASGL